MGGRRVGGREGEKKEKKGKEGVGILVRKTGRGGGGR